MLTAVCTHDIGKPKAAQPRPSGVMVQLAVRTVTEGCVGPRFDLAHSIRVLFITGATAETSKRVHGWKPQSL